MADYGESISADKFAKAYEQCVTKFDAPHHDEAGATRMLSAEALHCMRQKVDNIVGTNKPAVPVDISMFQNYDHK